MLGMQTQTLRHKSIPVLAPHYRNIIENHKIELRAEACRRSLSLFVQEFWSSIESEPLIWNWHLDVYCAELEKVARRVFGIVTKDEKGNIISRIRQPKEYDLLVNVPPGTSKSKVFTVMFPVWCWTNDPSLRFINGSYSGDLSLEHADISRDLIKSLRFKMYYPHIQIRPDKDAKGSYHNTDKGSRWSTSVGGTVTGMHAHIMVIDDPLNPKKAASDVELKSANHWVEQTLATRKVDKHVTVTIYVMQRLHEKDPAGVMLEKMRAGKKQVRHICLPGEIHDETSRAKVSPLELVDQYINGMLDPVRMGKSVLDELMVDLGQYGYAGQILQSPSPPGGGMFKTEKIEIVKMPPSNNILKTMRYWDKAGTDAKDNPGSCHTAGVKMGVLQDNNPFGKKYIVLDVVRGQWATEEREAIIRQTAQLDGVNTEIWIEQEPGSSGKDSARWTVQNLAGFNIQAQSPTGDKVTRADPFSVQCNWGNICLAEGKWNYDYIAELQSFPLGKNKDQVDASSGVFNKLAIQGKRAGVWGK